MVRDTGWFKSSHSAAASNSCVEVRIVGVPNTGWFKSSFSGAADDQCVEIRVVPGRIGIRDSKDHDGDALWVGSDAWSVFLTGVHATGW